MVLSIIPSQGSRMCGCIALLIQDDPAPHSSSWGIGLRSLRGKGKKVRRTQREIPRIARIPNLTGACEERRGNFGVVFFITIATFFLLLEQVCRLL
jgi:hypothetical protein